jgi:hypothetical protein
MTEQDGLVRDGGSAVAEEAYEDALPVGQIRVAELGRAPKSVSVGPDEELTIGELVAENHISSPDFHFFINGRQAGGIDALVRAGDSVVAIKRINAGV